MLRQAGQVGEFQERHALRVFVFFVPVHDPIIRIPDGNSRECFAVWIERERPALQAHRGPDRNPRQAAVRDFAPGPANRFASGEIEIMRRDCKLPAADPELQQAGIDIHQGRAPETREQRRSNGVMKVKQEVRPFKNGLSVGPIAAGVFFRQTGRRSRPAALVEHEFAPETEPFHSSQERSQPGPVRFFTAVAGETFQPINVAAQQTQGLGVLHVNPEVPASLREIDHVERRYDDCRHVRPSLSPRIPFSSQSSQVLTPSARSIAKTPPERWPPARRHRSIRTENAGSETGAPPAADSVGASLKMHPGWLSPPPVCPDHDN